MRKWINRTGIVVVCVWLLAISASAARMLIPGGQAIGLELGDNTVTVAAFDGKLGAAAKDAGLKVGDQIVSVNGQSVHTAADVRKALNCSDGIVELSVQRGIRSNVIRMEPAITEMGPKLGVYLKQGVTGVGTLTWYDPNTGKFATLGHRVNNVRGEQLELVSGTAYKATIVSVRKGTCGDPGQLMGAMKEAQPVGTLYKNAAQGVFGITQSGWTGEPLPVGTPADVQTGPAMIRCTVQGDTVQEYSVEILKVYPHSGASGRNMLLKITDPQLLDITGGIVQGMGVSYNKDNQWNP